MSGSLCIAHFGAHIGPSRHGPFTACPLLPGGVGEEGISSHVSASSPVLREGHGAVALVAWWLLRRLWPALPWAAAAAAAATMLLRLAITLPGSATAWPKPPGPAQDGPRGSRAALRSLLVTALGAVLAALGIRVEKPQVAIALTVFGASAGVPFPVHF